MDTTIRPFERSCPRCGLIFLARSFDGLCPSCLLTNTLDLESPEDGPAFWEEPPQPKKLVERSFSHFEILDELGRGGMGVVYRARDLNTERILAVKVLQAHHLQEPDVVHRFRSEVRAVSSLDHPHILPIHEVGEDNSIPFFSMKLTTGGSLAQNLGRYLGKPREAAQLLAKVARGVQHAHERGILHRDLKPGNILIDAGGEPYVADFGLAKWIDDDRNLTMTSAVLGTPHYIAPEQASGSKALTTSVDIYSLGAILYELLTGRPPFIGTSVLETLMASREKTPERPSTITANVPRDLETICLKSLQYEPSARYASARAFADDMESWLAGRTIQARPVNAAEQLWRWAKRNPLPAGLVAALMTAVTIIAVGAVIAAVHIDKSLRRAVVAENDARQKLHQSLLAQAHAWRLTGLMGQRTDALEAIRQAVQINPDLVARNDAIAALTLPDAQKIDEFGIREHGKLGVAFDRNLQHVAVGRQNFSVDILDISSKHIVQSLHGSNSPIRALAYGGDRYLAGSAEDETLSVWDLSTGVQTIKNVECRTKSGAIGGFFLNDSGDRVAAFGLARDGRIMSTATGEVLASIPSAGPICCGSFDHSGNQIAFVTEGERNLIRLYNLSDSSIQEIPTPFNAPATTLAWSADGGLLAVGCFDARTYVLDLHLHTLRATLSGHRQDVTQVLFADQDRLVVTTASDRSIRFWNLDSGSEQFAIHEYGGDPVLRLNEDGTRLATTDIGPNAAIFEIIRGSQTISGTLAPETLNEWAPLVASIDFSPDSKLLASASVTGIRLFDSASRVELTKVPFPEHQEGSVRFIDDDHILVVTPNEGIRRFAIRRDGAQTRFSAPEIIDEEKGYKLASPPAASSDTLALIPAKLGRMPTRLGLVRLFDAKTLRPKITLENLPDVWDYIVSPGGWEAASFADMNNTGVGIFSGKNYESLQSLNAGRTGTLTLSPNGRELITTGERGCLVWNIDGKGTTTAAPLTLMPAGRAAYSADGQFFATCADAPIQIFKSTTHELIATLEIRSPPGTSFRLRFSPNGQYLAAQASNNFIQLWDLVSLNQALRPLSLNWE